MRTKKSVVHTCLSHSFARQQEMTATSQAGPLRQRQPSTAEHRHRLDHTQQRQVRPRRAPRDVTSLGAAPAQVARSWRTTQPPSRSQKVTRESLHGVNDEVEAAGHGRATVGRQWAVLLATTKSEPRTCFHRGGGGGIRTHGGLPLTRFPSVPIRPLSHPSNVSDRPCRANSSSGMLPVLSSPPLSARMHRTVG